MPKELLLPPDGLEVVIISKIIVKRHCQITPLTRVQGILGEGEGCERGIVSLNRGWESGAN